MTRRALNVAAVSYLNTIPFLYGLRHSEESASGLSLPDPAPSKTTLLLSPPAGCTAAFDERRADIALVPVGGLAAIKDSDFDIVTSWCIGADGPVRTVVMTSNSPLKEIKRVWLDSHSNTSVALARVLAARHWNIAPKWLTLSDYSVLENPSEGDAFVLIGDKVFEHEGRFARTWDLAEEWKKYASLPFVFAVWVARKSVTDEAVAALEESLTLGMERIYESIIESEFADRPYAYEYLTRNIDFFFDEQKRQALQRFWDEGLKATLHANPG
ncbi:MAG: menaquinone biosynthesis protein [Alistipes sp.]|jgi:chorismate dehydratase|nr:menaquinone biosynthesis protein [Alistipes sp.]